MTVKPSDFEYLFQYYNALKSASPLHAYMEQNNLTSGPASHVHRLERVYKNNWDKLVLGYLKKNAPKRMYSSEVSWTGEIHQNSKMKWNVPLPNGEVLEIVKRHSEQREHLGYDPHVRSLHKD